MLRNNLLWCWVFLMATSSCAAQKHPHAPMEHSYTNALVHETSPYLLQHAHNPVNWLPWNTETLQKAREEHKPLLISIGYSACHWCHVMEHESFEDTAVAAIMNEHFICIKVDREERPDVDQVYMNAVQIMTGSGGWPLNCFALPDGRPFFGGTYFPKKQWVQVLEKVADAYEKQQDKLEAYAEQLTAGIAQSSDLPFQPVPEKWDASVLHKSVQKWEQSFDRKEGGPDRAPKFPLPVNYQFLMQYAHLYERDDVMQHVDLTLGKMAFGGIYDQLGGGFARYSTDAEWKVPHFEKMLYDNAQLVSLYAAAFQKTRNPLYKQVVYETIAFVERELTSPEGFFYSALDADSEGEEGRFYVWTQEEVRKLARDGFNIISDYYNVNSKGLWEDGNYILLRDKSVAEIALKHGISEMELEEHVSRFKAAALEERAKRARPGLDDKSLTSWNAMMVTALADAYMVFREDTFLQMAEKAANGLLKSQKGPQGFLRHSYKKGRSTIDGFLEDYAFMAEACIRLYEATFEDRWLMEANAIAGTVEENFKREENGLYQFTRSEGEALVAANVEFMDNVFPASNSTMAHNLFRLGLLLGDPNMLEQAERMLAAIEPNISGYPMGYGKWMQLLLMLANPAREVVIVGAEWQKTVGEMQQQYLPNVVYAGGEDEGNLMLLQGKKVEGKTIIYICEKGMCKQPVESVKEALWQLE